MNDDLEDGKGPPDETAVALDFAPIVLPPSKLRRSPLRSFIEWFVVVAGAFGLALLIQAFLFQPFRIPSGSMIPTLAVGDRIVVNKLSYKLHDPGRGEVVVFTTPDCATPRIPDWANCTIIGNYADLVKRIVALPGDEIAIADDHVYIDGEILDEPYLPEGATTVAQPPFGCMFPGTPEHPYVVPEGMVFVMGDNRNMSLDSRCFGPIPESTLVGRAFVVIWPLGRLSWL